MTQANLLDLAKQGDPRAIADLMNRSLQPRGMTAAVDVHGNCLEVVLEAAQIPNRQVMCAFVENGIKNLGVTTIQTIKVLGQQSGAVSPAWTQEIQIGADLPKADFAASPVESIAMPDASPQDSSLHPTPSPVAPFRPAPAPGELPLTPADASPEQAVELDLGLGTPEISTTSPEANNFDLGLDTDLEVPGVAANFAEGTPERAGLDLDFEHTIGLSEPPGAEVPEADLLADLSLADDGNPVHEASDRLQDDVASEDTTANLLPDLDKEFGLDQPSDATSTPTETSVSIDDWFTDEATTDQTGGESLELDQGLNLGMLDDMDHSSETAPTSEMTDLPHDAALADLLTTAETSDADWSLDLPGAEAPAATSELDGSFDLSITDTSSDMLEEEWSPGESDTEAAIAPLEDWGLDSLELPAEPTVASEEDWLAELSDAEPAPAITFDQVNWEAGETEQSLPTPPTPDESAWSFDLPPAAPAESTANQEEGWGDLGLSSPSESQWEAPVMLDDQGETWLLDDAVSPASESAADSEASESSASTDEWGLDLTADEDWGLDLPENVPDTSAQGWSLDLPEEPRMPPEITPESSEEWSLRLTDDAAGSEPPVVAETSAEDWSLGLMDDSIDGEPSMLSTPPAEAWSLDLPQDELPPSAPDISEEEWSLDLTDNSISSEAANLAETPTADWTLDLPEESSVAPEISEQEWSLDLMDDATAGETSPAAEPTSEEWPLDLPEASVDTGSELEIEDFSAGSLDLSETAPVDSTDTPIAASEQEWPLDWQEDPTSAEISASEDDWGLDLPAEPSAQEPSLLSEQEWSLDLPADVAPETAAPGEEWSLDLTEPSAPTPPAALEDDWTLDLPEENIAPELADLTAAGLTASQVGEHGSDAAIAQTEADWLLDLPAEAPPTSSSEVAEDWSLVAETESTTPEITGDDADWSLVDLPSPALVEPSGEEWSLDAEAAANTASDVTSPFAADDWSVAEGQEILNLGGAPTEAEELPTIAFEPESSTAPEVSLEAGGEPEIDLSLSQEWLTEEVNQAEDWSVPDQSASESPGDLPPDLDSVEEPEPRWLELPDDAIAPVPPAVSHYTLQPQPPVNEERPPLSFTSPEDNLELGDFDVAPTPEVDEADEVEPATLTVGSSDRPEEMTSRSGGLLYYVVLAGLLSWTMGLIGFSLMSNLSNPTPAPQPTVVPQSSSTNPN